MSLTHGFSTTTDFSSRVESYVKTDGQSASLSYNKVPIWGLWPDLYYCQTVAGMLMWGALSDERRGLSFIIAACPRQRSHSRARVPWDLRPYFTVSDSRLPFCRLLRLAGLRWRYMTPPPRWIDFTVILESLSSELLSNLAFSYSIAHRKQFPLLRFRGNVFIGLLPRNVLHNPVVLLLLVGPCLRSRCLAMHWSNTLQYYKTG
jgi:hypothetical protein